MTALNRSPTVVLSSRSAPRESVTSRLSSELWAQGPAQRGRSRSGICEVLDARWTSRTAVTAATCGFVDTPLNKVFAEEVGVEVAARDTGLGKVAQPQDVANVIAFLSSGLATHATGTTIDVDGASYVR